MRHIELVGEARESTQRRKIYEDSNSTNATNLTTCNCNCNWKPKNINYNLLTLYATNKIN